MNTYNKTILSETTVKLPLEVHKNNQIYSLKSILQTFLFQICHKLSLGHRDEFTLQMMRLHFGGQRSRSP